MKPRQNELTAVAHREHFDELPRGADPAELPRWQRFRQQYHAAANLEVADFPLQIDFELNSSCQMKCAFCVHGFEKVPKRALSMAAFRRVIDEGAEHGLCSIKLNYINEPLLNRDLPAFVRYARQKGVLNVYFATNGLLLTEKVSKDLIDCGVSKVMVSLDATTPETFLKVRRSPHFERIVENVERLLAMPDRPMVRVNFLRSPLNEHEADEFIRRWDGVADMLGFQTRVGLPGIETDVQPPLDEFRCSFPFKMVVIDSGGNILPCCTFSGREMPIGHIEHDTIAAAWNSEKMRALRHAHSMAAWRCVDACRGCVGG